MARHRDLSDEELVDEAGAYVAGMDVARPTAARLRAQAELTRRLIDAMRDLRVETAASSRKMETLTRWLVGLTVALVVLTVVIVIAGLR